MQDEPFEVPIPGGTLRGHRGGTGAVVEPIPDCGHFAWLEQPAAFRAAVERLIARRQAAAAG